MDSENSQLAGALYHTLRAVLSPKPRAEGSARIVEAIVRRNRRDEATRRFYAKLEAWDWDRRWG